MFHPTFQEAANEDTMVEWEDSEGAAAAGGQLAGRTAGRKAASIVLIAGFETFNVGLYKQAAALLREKCPGGAGRPQASRALHSVAGG